MLSVEFDFTEEMLDELKSGELNYIEELLQDPLEDENPIWRECRSRIEGYLASIDMPEKRKLLSELYPLLRAWFVSRWESVINA